MRKKLNQDAEQNHKTRREKKVRLIKNELFAEGKV